MAGRWKDQGWGNPKGQVAILAYTTTTTRDEDIAQNVPVNQLSWNELQQPHRQRRLVCCTDQVAEHDWLGLALNFTPRHNEKYYLYMKAGGGGGHTLLLEDIVVRNVFMDRSSDRSISDYLRILSNLNRNGDQIPAPVRLEMMVHDVGVLYDRLQGNDDHLGQDGLAQLLHWHGIILMDGALFIDDDILMDDDHSIDDDPSIDSSIDDDHSIDDDSM